MGPPSYMQSVVHRNVMRFIPVIYYMFRLQSSTCTFASKINIFIVTIIHHQLGLDKPVAASSNSLFKGIPSRLRPFGLHFSIIFGILVFNLVTCRSQFDLNLFSFSSTVSIFSSSKISSFLLWSSRLTSNVFRPSF